MWRHVWELAGGVRRLGLPLNGSARSLAVVPEPLPVEVFPVSDERWVAVIGHPAGAFSTEARTPEEVVGEVEGALRQVLGEPVPAYRLTAPNGREWSSDIAREQAAALDE